MKRKNIYIYIKLRATLCDEPTIPCCHGACKKKKEKKKVSKKKKTVHYVDNSLKV